MKDVDLLRAIAEDRGWKYRLATNDNPVERNGMRLPNTFGPEVEAWWHPNIEGVYGSPPNYLDEKNPGPALELIEVLGDEGLWVVCRRVPGGRWEVKVHDETLKVYVEVSATSFCRAVCEAYLKVRGKWSD